MISELKIVCAYVWVYVYWYGCVSVRERGRERVRERGREMKSEVRNQYYAGRHCGKILTATAMRILNLSRYQQCYNLQPQATVSLI